MARQLIVSWKLYAVAGLLGLGLALPFGAARQERGNDLPAVTPAQAQFFESKIRPILAENCWKCHGDKKQKGSLRLDSRSALVTGGDSGPAIVPRYPEKSLLIKAISHTDDELKMPPSGKLAKEQIADLTMWIQSGAPWPGADKESTTPVRKGEFQITDKDRQHWAFQPVKRPPLPAIKNKGWVSNPVDAFVLARLEEKGLEPSPPATKRELARRLWYDLTGLPPTPAEMDRFLADTSPTAYEDLVDRLLASPHYGERWARHWLDLVRYAETNSYERDNPKPNVWRFRDYVIRSFNRDTPYDRFLKEQLAGDELAPGDNDALVATGFYRLGIWDDEPSDPLQAVYDGLDDIVTTTSQVFLGLTVDCARCHNHKIDPIAQKDYYRLVAFFKNINHFRNGGPTDEQPILTPETKKAYDQQVAELEKKRKDVQGELAAVEKDYRDAWEKSGKAGAPDLGQIAKEGPALIGKETVANYQKLKKQLDALNKQRVPADMALCVTEKGSTPEPTFVLGRGNPAVKNEAVTPGFPQVFNVPDPVIPAPAAGARTTGRRLALANWIASPENPMTARVMVNRIWQHHFGRGIVRSPNDFGFQGSRPTHPELLDWLASEFVAGGWRMKSLHKLILTSSAYKMSSRGNPKGLAADPANDFFWRVDMRRLTAEEIRDSVLAVSGNINPAMFGPSVYPEMPKEILAGQSMPGRGWGKSTPQEQARRSVYVHVKRSLLYPMLESFDLAEPDRTTPVRFSSTQPTQALLMMNSEFVNKQAAIFAERLKKEAGKETAAQVRLAWLLATQRPPTEAEVRRGVALIEALQREDGLSADAALSGFCLVVLNLNEFVYLD
jgi:hypothetical protein